VFFERVDRGPAGRAAAARAPPEGTSGDRPPRYPEEPVAVIDLTAEQQPPAVQPARRPPGKEELYERLKKLKSPPGLARASPEDVGDVFSKAADKVRLKKALTKKFGKEGAKEIRTKSKHVASAFFADVTVEQKFRHA